MVFITEENKADLRARHRDRKDPPRRGNPSMLTSEQGDETAGKEETDSGIVGNVSQFDGKIGMFW